MHSGTDTPLASEVLDDAGDGLGYRWLLTSKERAHIAGLLDCAGMYSSPSPFPVDLPPSYPSSQQPHPHTPNQPTSQPDSKLNPSLSGRHHPSR